MKKIYSTIFIVFIFLNSYGQYWQQFGNGIELASSFYIDSSLNRLCLIGKVVNQNNDTVYSPAYWDGQGWVPIGNNDFTNTGAPMELFKYNNTYYLGGLFKKTLGAPADYILMFNGSSWDSLDFSPDAGVLSFYEYQNRLYIGGRFSLFGPLWSIGVVIHNPPFWSTIPPFTHWPFIQTMTKYNNRLVFAGLFTSDLTLQYKGNIVEWDGINVLPMDEGLDINDLIVDLEVYNNKLYAGGLFSSAANVFDGKRIVSWDGQIWSNVGGGLNGDIFDLQVYDGNLYAAGSFTLAGNVSVDNIAKWDGTKWCSLGSNFNGFISNMCVYNNELIVMGAFTEIDGQPVNHMAKWVGGNYTDSCQVVGIDEFNIEKHFSVFPSPVKNILNVKSDKYEIEQIKITDLTGKYIYTKTFFGTNHQFNISFLSSGLYFLILETNKGCVVKKFVKE